MEINKLAEVIEEDVRTTKKILTAMAERYEQENRGIYLTQFDSAVQLSTKAEMYEYLIKIAKQPKKYVLTDVLLETLSIIAYKQPVTKAEIEKIRGVSSDHAVNRLVEAGLIEECGRLDQPGRPMLFATTREFLRRFGLVNTEQLPDIRSEQVEMFKLEAEEEIGYKPEAAEAAMNPQGIAQAEAAAEEPVLGAEAQPDEEAQDQPAQDE